VNTSYYLSTSGVATSENIIAGVHEVKLYFQSYMQNKQKESIYRFIIWLYREYMVDVRFGKV
jgi:hypothetical protein